MIGRYDPQRVTQHYDEMGEREWHRLTASPRDEVSLHIHTRFLTEHIPPFGHVLEVGAGPGRFTRVLAEAGARVVVGDLSPVQLDLNRKYAQDQGFEHAVVDRRVLDVCDLRAFANGEFDAVVAYGGPLSYVFERRDEAMAEVLRVLRPGGVALLSVMSLRGTVRHHLPGVLAADPRDNEQVLDTGDRCPETCALDSHHCHMFRSEELAELISAAGGEVLAVAASNALAAGWGGKLDEVRADEEAWQRLLELEWRTCREPGCADGGTHLIAVAGKPAEAA